MLLVLPLLVTCPALGGAAPVQPSPSKAMPNRQEAMGKPRAPVAPMRAGVTGKLKMQEKEVMRWPNRAVHGNGVGAFFIGATAMKRPRGEVCRLEPRGGMGGRIARRNGMKRFTVLPLTALVLDPKKRPDIPSCLWHTGRPSKP